MPQLPPLTLIADELSHLTELAWDGELPCSRLRSLILLDLHAGHLRKDIATKFGVNRGTVANTERAWLERGFLSLYPLHGGGVAPKITQDACAAMAKWAEIEALNSTQIRLRLAEQFSITASANLVARTLGLMGFVWKRTRCWLKKNATPPLSSKRL